ncbi:uncharacterized protein CANTADRAFT_43976 [Suhomyces tanzawaensis NRRL Y-17324]|uniref:Symplekin/Pta1 N-terminal domain-containing protein n=1 Tax=Suhomyces tanzawaensis NRRL Y-17324 TaxID=984487 RepID=A0A1E4SRD1_9ASCO|nr:uncharacterized protein CANTADRAFT_43976 [Suhomyces tanzawaensis NRRL Y-17324]ODV82069.1 hypothetical protein CANTADRAFT_43976 [Suhomyces tanzawaensis NRRL Y-17324]
MSFSPDQIVEQLDQAKNLAYTDASTYPQVLRQILNFVTSPESKIQLWCVQFLKESFVENKIANHSDKVDLAIDSLDSLVFLSNIPNLHIFKHVISISSVIYRLVFRYVAENDGCNPIWSKLTELKNSLVNKFQSNFPLEASDNEEFDLFRNIDTKIELVKFMMLVIDYQSKSTVINGSSSNGSVSPPPNTFSLNNVTTTHSLIKYSNMEYEAVNLLDLLLKTFSNNVIVAPLITATLNHFIIIMKRKPQYVTKILNMVENYDTNAKFQSNYQSLEEFKLAKKYVDRIFRVFLFHILRNNLVPTNYQNTLNKKMNQLVERGNDIRKKNIFVINEPNIRKRKFDGFLNPTKKIKTLDYKNLYCLNDINSDLNNFDLTSVPQHILTQMVVTALKKASVNKVTKALEIISERYTDAILGPGVAIKKEDADEDDDDDDVGENYNPETVYTLPPPTDLSFQEKKEHISIIIKNFFKLANNPNGISPEEEKVGDAEEGINKELTKTAINSWKKDSWLVLLTRLATRGMRSAVLQEDEDNEAEKSPDAKANEEMSDMIRTAIFDYFLDNIHSRIDLIIEWLNEEWYSEKVFNEEIQIRKAKAQKAVKQEASDDAIVDTPPVETAKVETPIYNKWAGKVLDSMIPFLEPNDRKIFIRLLSDLPYLNEDLVGRIKSLCLDPVRIKIGFLSLQFLIMYRPPVKDVCLKILTQLSESDQDDLREEAKKLLAKYSV